MSGKHVASCGCSVNGFDDLVDVMWMGEDCDAVDGFKPCVFSASYCRQCADRLKAEPEWLGSWADAHAWLRSQEATP